MQVPDVIQYPPYIIKVISGYNKELYLPSLAQAIVSFSFQPLPSFFGYVMEKKATV